MIFFDFLEKKKKYCIFLFFFLKEHTNNNIKLMKMQMGHLCEQEQFTCVSLFRLCIKSTHSRKIQRQKLTNLSDPLQTPFIETIKLDLAINFARNSEPQPQRTIMVSNLPPEAAALNPACVNLGATR